MLSDCKGDPIMVEVIKRKKSTPAEPVIEIKGEPAK